MTNYKIYIVTRFNADAFKRRQRLTKHNLDTGWLKARLDLFKEYCYPSVMNQRWKGFEWVLWCHPRSPDWLRDELAMMTGATTVYADCVKEYLDKEVDIRVTTRLDSDDMLYYDFMWVIYKHVDDFIASGLKRQVYSFKYGYKYAKDAGPRGTLWKVTQKTAPFLTLFADIREDDTDSIVYCRHHDNLPGEFDTVYNDDAGLPAWVWIEHGANIAGTALKITGLADITKTLARFGVSK